MFYKAIVQAVLLYGCETWVVTPAILQLLASFHNRIARRISGKMPRLVQGQWVYPPLEDALAEAGLFPLEIYIRRRQDSIATYIASRPIYTNCCQADPAPATSDDASQELPRRSKLYRYWSQPFKTTPMPPLPNRPTEKKTPQPAPPIPAPVPTTPTPTTHAPATHSQATPTVETVEESSDEEEGDVLTVPTIPTTASHSTPTGRDSTKAQPHPVPTTATPTATQATPPGVTTTPLPSMRGSAPGPDDDPGPPPPPPRPRMANVARVPPVATPGTVSTTPGTASTVSSLTHSTSSASPVPHLPRPPSMRAFTTAEWELIQAALSLQGLAAEELSQVGPIPLTRRSFRSLIPGTWLNDEVINGHILLFCQREALSARLQQVPNAHGHVFSSFFFSLLLQAHNPDPRERNTYNYSRVRSWGNRTPGHNIFLLRTLVIPVHIDNNHWACVSIDFTRHTISYLDSAHNEERATRYTTATLQYLQDEHLQRVRRPFPDLLWSITRPQIPQQDNGHDCGVFVCTFIDYILRDQPWDFDARHTRYLRYRMALTLLRQHLMD